MQPVITDLAGLFHYIFRLHDETKRGMSAALSSCPKCHFAMLETLSTLIAKHGHEGTIYVSQLAEASRQAKCTAALTAAPEDIPASTPSQATSSRPMCKASSSVIRTTSSTRFLQ